MRWIYFCAVLSFPQKEAGLSAHLTLECIPGEAPLLLRGGKGPRPTRSIYRMVGDSVTYFLRTAVPEEGACSNLTLVQPSTLASPLLSYLLRLLLNMASFVEIFHFCMPAVRVFSHAALPKHAVTHHSTSTIPPLLQHQPAPLIISMARLLHGPCAVNCFLHRWHSLHRTRQGSHGRASVCPAGANAVVVVMSSTLEVLVYAPDGLPYLKPTYGNAPCLSNTVDDYQRSVDLHDDSTREEHSDASLPSNGPIRGSERENESSDLDKSQEETTDDIGMVEERPMPVRATETRHMEGWPHEPRFCASVWPVDDTGDDNSTAAGASRSVTPRLAVLKYRNK